MARGWTEIVIGLVLAVGGCGKDGPAAGAAPAPAPYVDRDYRFTLTPPSAAWHIVDAAGAQARAPDVIAAMAGPTSLVTVAVTRWTGSALDLYAARILDSFRLEDGQRAVHDTLVDGRAERRYRVSGRHDGYHVDLAGRIFLHQGFGYHVALSADWLTEPVIDSALGAFALSPGPVVTRPAPDVIDLGPPTEVIGVDFVLRDRTYQDYRHHLWWTAPPGDWRIAVGTEAVAAAGPGTRLHAVDPATGTLFILQIEPIDGRGADLGSRDGVVTSTGTIAGRVAQRFDQRVTAAGRPMHGREYQLELGAERLRIITAIPGAQRPDDAAVEALAARLLVIDDLAADDFDRDEGAYIDHQFGFRMALPATWQPRAMPAIAGPNRVRQWRRGDEEIYVAARYLPEPGADAQLIAEIQRTFGVSELVPIQRDSATIGGLTGPRLRWQLHGKRIEMTLVRRGAVHFAIAVVATPDSDAGALAVAGFAPSDD